MSQVISQSAVFRLRLELGLGLQEFFSLRFNILSHDSYALTRDSLTHCNSNLS